MKFTRIHAVWPKIHKIGFADWQATFDQFLYTSRRHRTKKVENAFTMKQKIRYQKPIGGIKINLCESAPILCLLS
jgi:hypothetical protein